MTLTTINAGHLTSRQISCLQQVLWKADGEYGVLLTSVSFYVADADPTFEWDRDDHAVYERGVAADLSTLVDFGLLTTYGEPVVGAEFTITPDGLALLDGT